MIGGQEDSRSVLPSLSCILANDLNSSGVEARLVFDSASDKSYVRFSTAESAGLIIENRHSSIVQAIGAARVAIKTAKCSAVLKSKCSDFSFKCTLRCLDKIGGDIAPLPVNITNIPQDFRRSVTEELPRRQLVCIDILIGLDFLHDLLDGIIKTGDEGRLMIWNTKLGVAISGSLPVHEFYLNSLNAALEPKKDELLDALKSFWQWETLGIREEKHAHLTKDELFVEQHYASNTIYDGKKYTVSLPFHPSAPKPNNNYLRALAAFKSLENSLLRPGKEEKFNRYIEAMEKYIQADQVELVETFSPQFDRAYVIPHRDVQRDDHETTKTIIVFNASAKAVLRGVVVMTLACKSEGPGFESRRGWFTFSPLLENKGESCLICAVKMEVVSCLDSMASISRRLDTTKSQARTYLEADKRCIYCALLPLDR